MDQVNQIIHIAQKLFFENGTKSISVDDICAEMGISKKTLYKYFGSKDEIVDQLLDQHICMDKELHEKIKLEAKDAIEEIKAIFDNNKEHHTSLKPIFLNDLKKWHPTTWARLQVYLDDHINTCILANIARGQAEGYFRLDLDPIFITNMYTKGIFALMDFFGKQTNYSMADLDREYMLYHIRGIGTDKAHKKLKTFQF